MGELILATDIPDTALAAPFKRAAYAHGLRDEPFYDGVVYERRIANRFLGLDAKAANALYRTMRADGVTRLPLMRGTELEGVSLDAGTLGELCLFLLCANTPRQVRNDLGFVTLRETENWFYDFIEASFLRAAQTDAVSCRRMIVKRFDDYTACMSEGIRGYFERPFDIRIIGN